MAVINDPTNHEFQYMMLSRLQSDCLYFLNWGNGGNSLWGITIESHIAEMKRLWLSLPVKPEWLTYPTIEAYEIAMLLYIKRPIP